jgi:hypothetical protein
MELTDDIKPIYLGYEITHNKYYFYFIKEKAPRFLVYARYFYWGLAPQSVLSLVPVPEEIEQELEEFLSGNLNYEFSKVRKNSKVASVHKVYRLPQQVEQSSSVVDRGRAPGNNRDPLQPVPRSKQGIRDGNEITIKRKKPKETEKIAEFLLKKSLGLNNQVLCPVVVIEPKRKRRTKVEMEELKKLLIRKVKT